MFFFKSNFNVFIKYLIIVKTLISKETRCHLQNVYLIFYQVDLNSQPLTDSKYLWGRIRQRDSLLFFIDRILMSFSFILFIYASNIHRYINVRLFVGEVLLSTCFLISFRFFYYHVNLVYVNDNEFNFLYL